MVRLDRTCIGMTHGRGFTLPPDRHARIRSGHLAPAPGNRTSARPGECARSWRSPGRALLRVTRLPDGCGIRPWRPVIRSGSPWGRLRPARTWPDSLVRVCAAGLARRPRRRPSGPFAGPGSGKEDANTEDTEAAGGHGEGRMALRAVSDTSGQKSRLLAGQPIYGQLIDLPPVGQSILMTSSAGGAPMPFCSVSSSGLRVKALLPGLPALQRALIGTTG